MLRRDFVKTVSITAAAILATPLLETKLFAGDPSVAEIIAKETGGKGAKDMAMLIAPAIAENGLVVPLRIESDIAIEKVKAVSIFALGNPTPRIITAQMSPEMGKVYFSTRTKLGKGQEILALMELTDGTFVKDVKSIKVTVGGCG